MLLLVQRHCASAADNGRRGGGGRGGRRGGEEGRGRGQHLQRQRRQCPRPLGRGGQHDDATAALWRRNHQSRGRFRALRGSRQHRLCLSRSFPVPRGHLNTVPDPPWAENTLLNVLFKCCVLPFPSSLPLVSVASVCAVPPSFAG